MDAKLKALVDKFNKLNEEMAALLTELYAERKLAAAHLDAAVKRHANPDEDTQALAMLGMIASHHGLDIYNN
jgi:hypothetical protein